jgi:DNA-binding MarR family transcriptional regulator
MSSHPVNSQSGEPYPRTQTLEALMREIREFIAGVILFNQSAAARLGINLTDCQCLNILQMHGAVSAGQLAKVTGLTTGAITGVIDRLEKAHFVQRIKDPHDRRKVIVTMLADRQAEIDMIYQAPSKTTTQLLEQYTDPELTIVLDFFTKITDLRNAQSE